MPLISEGKNLFILLVPKVQLIIALCLIYLTTLMRYPIYKTLPMLVVSVGTCIFTDLVFAYLRRKKLFIPYAAIATGLIIGLIVDQGSQLYQIAFIGTLAMGIKNFLRVGNRHIFNPAAIGLFLGGIIFNLSVAWWGVSFQNFRLNPLSILLFIILISPALVSAINLRRYFSILSFILVFTMISFLLSTDKTISILLSILLTPAFIFFSLVMLPEPMTSPVNSKRQILYGSIVAAVAILFSTPQISRVLLSFGLLPDIFIPALLIGNALFFKYR